MTFPLSPTGADRCVLAHARLHSIELRGTGMASAFRRPAELQVYVEDVHHRVESDEFLPAGEKPGMVRIAGRAEGGFPHRLSLALMSNWCALG